MSDYKGIRYNNISKEPIPEPDAKLVKEFKNKVKGRFVGKSQTLDPKNPDRFSGMFKKHLEKLGLDKHEPDKNHWSSELVNPWKEPLRSFPVHEHGPEVCIFPYTMTPEMHEDFLRHLARVNHDMVRATVDLCWALDKLGYDAEAAIYANEVKLSRYQLAFDSMIDAARQTDPRAGINFEQIVGWKHSSAIEVVEDKFTCNECWSKNFNGAAKNKTTTPVTLMQAIEENFQCHECQRFLWREVKIGI